MDQKTFDRAAEDLGNAIHLEHVNVTIPDQRIASLFYGAGLGLTRDPYLQVMDDNMWMNVGRSQFHPERQESEHDCHRQSRAPGDQTPSLVAPPRRSGPVPAHRAGRRDPDPGGRLAAAEDHPAVGAEAGHQQVRLVPQRRHHAVRRPAELRRRTHQRHVLVGGGPHPGVHRGQRRTEHGARTWPGRPAQPGVALGPGAADRGAAVRAGPYRPRCPPRSSPGCSTTSTAWSTTC